VAKQHGLLGRETNRLGRRIKGDRLSAECLFEEDDMMHRDWHLDSALHSEHALLFEFGNVSLYPCKVFSKRH
jgi:hypothetical protein